MSTPAIDLPVIITGPGLYLTRAGHKVRMTDVRWLGNGFCIGYYLPGNKMWDTWPPSGRRSFISVFDDDIVSKCPEGLKPISTYTIS